MPTITLEPLTLPQAETVYRQHLTRDFPPAELKPFSSIRRMMQAGIYEPLLVRADGAAAGYAFLTVAPGQAAALLDYLGVLPELRSAGLGGEILSLLAARYTGRLRAVLIESEYPPESPDPALAERRLGFYRRGGARQTGVAARVFGVRYVVFALGCGGAAMNDAEVQRGMERIYRQMLPPQKFADNIFLGEGALHPEYYHGTPME